MKKFNEMKLELIKSEIVRLSAYQKELKQYIRENKESLRSGCSKSERNDIIKSIRYQRGLIVNGKDMLTYF